MNGFYFLINKEDYCLNEAAFPGWAKRLCFEWKILLWVHSSVTNSQYFVLTFYFSNLFVGTVFYECVSLPIYRICEGNEYVFWRNKKRIRILLVVIVWENLCEHFAKACCVNNLCEHFAKACNDFSMTNNLKKTVVMSLGTSIPPRILVSGSLLNVVDKFSYLVSVVNSSNNLDDEINQ